jgi:hypothetical protein
MEIKLKKADDLIDIYQQFETVNPLTPKDKDFYIDIYDKDIRELRNKIILNQNPNKAFFVTGQSGNGKTTALNFLQNEKILKLYDVKVISGNNYLNLDDIDIIDIILTIGFIFAESDNKIKEKYFEKLEEFKKKKLGELKKYKETTILDDIEKGSKGDFGAKLSLLSLINFGAGFFENFKHNERSREIVREAFSFDKFELIDLINDMISNYEDTQHNKRQLIIIDDLEKIRRGEQAEKIFIQHADVFEKIECVKIITLPVYISANHALYQNMFKFSIRTIENPHKQDNEKNLLEKNKKILENLILTRLADKSLIKKEALKLSVEKSGGNIRSLINIIQTATIIVLSESEDYEEKKYEKISEKNIRNSIENIAELPYLAVMGRIKALKQIKDTNKEPDKEFRDDFIKSILDNTIYAYFNGLPWYEINPIVKEGVEYYSK